MNDVIIELQEDLLKQIEHIKAKRSSGESVKTYLIMRNSNESLIYTVEEVAEILKTNKNFIYDLIKKGYIKALKLGRLKITKTELLRFLEEYNGKDFSNLDNLIDLKLNSSSNTQ